MKTNPECRLEPGVVSPRIDRNRCEGKGDCVRVCPVGVFSVGTLPKGSRAALSVRGKIKGMVHRWQQAMLLHAERCEACGLCVTACPEQAITLARRENEPGSS